MKFLTDDNLKKFWKWYLLPEILKKHNISIMINHSTVKSNKNLQVGFLSLSDNGRLGTILNYYRDVHHLILVPDYDVNLKQYFSWIIEGGETQRGLTLDKFDSYDDMAEAMLLKADGFVNKKTSVFHQICNKGRRFRENTADKVIKIEARVVMTLSEKPKVNGQNIYRKGEGNLKLPITGAEARRLAQSGYSPFELSFTSDCDINSGDHYYDPRGIIHKADDDPNLEFLNESAFKKVIASTDNSLDVDTPLHERKYIPCNNQLPQIPYLFLVEFVKAKGEIDKVFVEHENPFPEAMGNVVFPTVLKTTDENEVIIHLTK